MLFLRGHGASCFPGILVILFVFVSCLSSSRPRPFRFFSILFLFGTLRPVQPRFRFQFRVFIFIQPCTCSRIFPSFSFHCPNLRPHTNTTFFCNRCKKPPSSHSRHSSRATPISRVFWKGRSLPLPPSLLRPCLSLGMRRGRGTTHIHLRSIRTRNYTGIVRIRR